MAAKYEATKTPFTTAFGQLNQLPLDLERASLLPPLTGAGPGAGEHGEQHVGQ